MFDASQQPGILGDDILVLAAAMKQLAIRAHLSGDARAGAVLDNIADLLQTVLPSPAQRALAA